MTWPLVIDTTRDRPLIGSTWVRKDPQEDVYDRVVIRGVFTLSDDLGSELCVSPVEFGPTLTASPESLAESYVREDDPDDGRVEKLRDTLRNLEART